MNYLIYKIINNINGKIYIGAHKAIEINDGYMGSGIAIRNAIKKYGIENFTKTILYNTNSIEDMFTIESEIVNEDFINRNDTYNLMPGGTGSTKNWTTNSYERVLVGSIKGNKTRQKNAQSPKAQTKRKETFKKNKHSQGHRNSQFGTHIYCDQDGNNRQRYKNGDQPNNWITTTEYRKSKLQRRGCFGQHWYNNGIKSFIRYEEDALKEGLFRGRL